MDVIYIMNGYISSNAEIKVLKGDGKWMLTVKSENTIQYILNLDEDYFISLFDLEIDALIANKVVEEINLLYLRNYMQKTI